MVRVLAVVFSVWSSLAFAGTPAELIILGGAKTEAEGKEILEKAKTEVATWKEVLSPAAGFPKLVRSDSIEGLKPGFFIAVLGACAKANEPNAWFDFARSRIQGVYVRPVTWAEETLPCPRYAQETREANVKSAVLKVKGQGELIVVTPGITTDAMVTLLDKAGAPSATETIQTGAMSSCRGRADVMEAANGRALEFSCVAVTRGCTSPEETEFVTRARVVKGQIELTSTEKVVSPCQYDH